MHSALHGAVPSALHGAMRSALHTAHSTPSTTRTHIVLSLVLALALAAGRLQRAVGEDEAGLGVLRAPRDEPVGGATVEQHPVDQGEVCRARNGPRGARRRVPPARVRGCGAVRHRADEGDKGTVAADATREARLRGGRTGVCAGDVRRVCVGCAGLQGCPVLQWGVAVLQGLVRGRMGP